MADAQTRFTPHQDLTKVIDATVGEVRTEHLDLSFGEIINLHNQKELVIKPEYQRLFRWSMGQRSRLIESILLELPIPQIFLIEAESGILELIDGLQRISSVIHFVSYKDIKGLKGPLMMEGCELIPALNDMVYTDLPLVLQLKVKRSKVRAVIIKRQSKYFLRYEMFKRLNAGGEAVMPQELRNCSARMLGEQGVTFYQFLQELAKNSHFVECIETMSTSDKAQRGDEELVLRYLALKNSLNTFKGSVRDWLDSYMESVIMYNPQDTPTRTPFNYAAERAEFEQLFARIAEVMGRAAFVKSRSGTPVGGLAPAYFEAVTMGFHRAFTEADVKDDQVVRSAVLKAIESPEFKENTGPAANTGKKLGRRIELIADAIRQAT